MILPFYEGDDEDPYVIMNILPELAQPFNTKMRAPFKVVFETVRLSEIKHFHLADKLKTAEEIIEEEKQQIIQRQLE